MFDSALQYYKVCEKRGHVQASGPLVQDSVLRLSVFATLEACLEDHFYAEQSDNFACVEGCVGGTGVRACRMLRLPPTLIISLKRNQVRASVMLCRNLQKVVLCTCTYCLHGAKISLAICDTVYSVSPTMTCTNLSYVCTCHSCMQRSPDKHDHMLFSGTSVACYILT